MAGKDIQCNVIPLDESNDEEEKKAYIDFICRLMLMMDVKQLRRMMNAAMDEI